jgi:malate dehydrogenase (quinone)
MLDVMQRLYTDQFSSFAPKFKEMIPSYGQKLNEKPALAEETLTQTAKILKLQA